MMISKPPTRYLETGEGRIAYDVRGEGPLLVCMPGMGDLRQSYRFLVPLLVEAGTRVATMDLRGAGESSVGWPSHSETAMGEDVIRLIRELGGPAVIVGHSFSPGAAIYAAVQAPDLVVGTVLVGPWAAPPPTAGPKLMLTRWVLGSPLLWGMFYKSLYPGVKPPDFSPYLRELRQTLREPGRIEALKELGEPAAKDARAYRERMKQPSLIVMGDKDPDFKDPAAEAEAMRDSLSSSEARVVMIPEAGHYPHAQFPEETTKPILKFLRDVSHVS